MEWLYWIVLVIAGAATLLLAVVGLPGLWLMLIMAAGYGWATGWDAISPWAIVAMFLLAAVAEVIESMASAMGAKKAGASKRAMILSVVGAIVGGLLLTGLIPVPVIGTIIGLCAGAFAGAVLGEVFKGRDRDQMVKSGIGAAAGRLAGMFIKLGIGSIMLLVLALAALPIWGRGGRASALPAAAPIPAATVPATATAPVLEVEEAQ